MKKLFTLVLILLFLPSILAINLKVEKQSANEVMIVGLDQTTSFDLKIKNLDQSSSFKFYNLLGFNMFPVGTISIAEGQTKDVKLEISPINKLNQRGAYTFSYFIRANDDSEVKKSLTFQIIELKDAFETGSAEINPDSNSINIYLLNKVNFDFKDLNVKFSSTFFNLEETFDLAPYEKKIFNIKLDQESFKKMMAGFYTLTTKIDTENQQTEIQGTIEFSEKDLLTTTKKDYGFVISTQIIKKINEGNTLTKSETIINKNIISRLFTSFSPEPDIVQRDGTTIHYTWSKTINPGESLEITVRTNWLFPLLAIALIISIVILVKRYSGSDLVLRKRVSFVRTKGGEFALKVSIFVNAKNYIERINIIDRLPLLVKIHQKFGSELPSRINEKTRRIEWNFEKLEAGETRVLSYIIYSKVGVLGKFALPSATAIYEKEGEIKETESNKAFFLSEQKADKREEGY
ncbi:MAG: hypothetical protein ABIA78_04100 [archaeon]